LEDGIVYIQITRGVAQRVHNFPGNTTPTLVAYTIKLNKPIENIANGVKTKLVEDIRWLRCDIKSLNLLGNVLAKQKAKDSHCFEAILFRKNLGAKENIVTEGTSTNVFIVKDHIIYTHPTTSLILNGITRQKVLDLIANLSLQVMEETFSTEEITSADEVFITSTTDEITPVIQIDKVIINKGIPGPITKQIQKEFKNLLPEPTYS